MLEVMLAILIRIYCTIKYMITNKDMSTEQDLYNDIKNIQEAINGNSIVIFVGAGVSANSGVPTWGSLISDIAKELGINKSIKPNEYLKIAQYYYNKNQSKFSSKVEQKLHKNWKPNEISKYLFKNYNARHFITTNYDDILEQTASEQSIPCTIISKDIDIPKIGNNMAIIKMHGDFNNQIVLKENDYLEYSQNFKLIETFVKSIFATSTVLFVGFSADDPNVNQIYSWVNNILEENKREAYLLQIDKRTKEYELQREYFDRKGIKIINYYDLVKEMKTLEYAEDAKKSINNLTHTKGKQLFKLLYFIKNFTPEYLENYYSRLKPTQYLNCMTNENIVKILGHSFWSCYRGKLTSHNDKIFNKFLYKLKIQDKYSNELKKLLSKIGITELISYKWVKENLHENNKLLLAPAKKPNFKAFELINSLNYIEAKKYLEKLNKKYSNNNYIDKRINSVNVFEKPYLLWKLEDFEGAYNLLKQITYKAKEKHLNIIFVIASFNKKLVGWDYYHQIKYENNKKNEFHLKELELELNSIDVRKLMNWFLTPYEKNVIESKLNFEYIKELDFKTLENQDKEQTTNPWLTGLYYTYTVNYIFMEGYQDYKKLCKRMVKAVMASIDRKRNAKKSKLFSCEEPIEFSLMEIILIITNLEPRDLREIIDNYKIENLILDNKKKVKIKNILLNSYHNWIDSIRTLDLCKDLYRGTKYFNYLYNFFTIFSLIDLTKKETSKVISSYIGLLEIYNYFNYLPNNDVLNYILDFIIIKYNNKETRKTIDYKVLIFFLKYFLRELIKQKEITKNALYRFARFAGNITYIIKNLNPTYLELSADINNGISAELLANIYTYIHKISNIKTKNKIRKIILESLSKNFNSELYHNACLENIIKPNKKYEDKLVLEIEDNIKQFKKLKIEKPNTLNGFTKNPVGLDDIYEKLIYVANLLNNDKITDSNKFQKYKQHKDFETNNYFNFTLDMNDYDYSKFDLTYLKYISDRRLKELKNILNKRQEIKIFLKHKLFDKIKIENDGENTCKNRLLYLIYDEYIN